ncbi:hypothetical protein [uncultured Dokdonia sp.]|uniref:hypothetical protein n=1 Tax=uncultured Dokdonia sp. TaxID=575653 RepID=UPI002621D92D|nr:hypothetical protein [uncultured Dokdonia sp.]
MKNLLNIGRSLSTIELKNITAGAGATFTRPDEDSGCSSYTCPEGACDIWGECITPGNGNGHICPENPGMNCDYTG